MRKGLNLILFGFSAAVVCAAQPSVPGALSVSEQNEEHREFFRTRATLHQAEAPVGVTAVVDASERHQVIDGFGASLAYTAQNITEELADLFFDPDRGIGLSLARIRINFRNTDEEGNITPNSWERRAALLAQERGAAVWASPWSAHGSLKEGNPTGDHLHRGGRLRPDAFATYAQNLVDFVRWANEQGLKLVAISPQNEPDYRFGNNESMDWTASELLGFITNHFRPALNAAGYGDLPIVAPELMDWHRQSGWQGFYNHAETGILAFHNYDWAFDFFRNGNDTRFPAPVNTDKRIWMTEISDVFSGQSDTDTIEDALIWAKHIHRVIVEASGSAWHWWWLVPPEHGRSNNETLVNSRNGVIEQNGNVIGDGLPHMLKRGWMIGQFARFVRPGDVRVEITPASDGPLRLAAFAGEDRLVVVAIHEGNEALPLRLEGLPPDIHRVHAWITSEEKNLAHQGQMPLSRPELELSLPQTSIVTLVFE